MKKTFISKIVFGLTLSALVFGCTANVTTNNPDTGNQTQTTKDIAKLGSASNSKMETFSSDNFKLTFKLPADMKEKVNTNDHFEADNAAITFQLFPWKDAKLSETDVLNAGLIGLNNIDKDSFKLDAESSGSIENLGGYNGFAVFGTAKQQGVDIYVGMLGLIDPKGAENYISYITLDKNKNTGEDTKNLNIGADIFLSFARK